MSSRKLQLAPRLKLVSLINLMPPNFPLQQEINLDTAWWDSMAFAYAGCYWHFNDAPSKGEILFRTSCVRRDFFHIGSTLPYCAVHPYSFRGCHCPLASPQGVPNHELGRLLVHSAANILRGMMATWDREFVALRQGSEGHHQVHIPWTPDHPVDTHLHLFGPGCVFDPDGMKP
jgi:hypothetical protein